ncbi:MAG: adenosylcobinamide-GDP ribazoletransferase [Deltaproteobacteria bacterium]|nr:adenosylcobinamide-GDP ribazoletransferase [Deltaproteobacteria bacterium]MBW2105052.1 adenosylcobinamide-GDP ribazoletransferase [Deltaproteobacteria bacterium]
MKQFISALQFLTILPLGKPRDFDAPKTIPWFPVVGLAIGFLLVLGDYVFSRLWPVAIVSVLDVLFLAVLSGGLHLDGLGDTADGMLSHRPLEQALTIMRDSRLGVMGLLAIVFILVIKWAGISSLGDHRALYLLIIPAYSRGAMMFGMKFLGYGRPQGGLGADFFSDKPPIYALSIILLPICISLWLGLMAIWLNALFILMTTLILFYYKRRMNGITGDMLGAMAEIEEGGLFLIACLGVGQ